MKSNHFQDLSKHDRRLSGSGIVQVFASTAEFNAGMALVPMDALTNRGG
jgi:hypothetical protein